MSKIGAKERSPKTEHRLKICFSGPLSQLVNLRMPVGPGANCSFHVSNPHVKVDPRFVADNIESVLAARFTTKVEDGQERIVAREAVGNSSRILCRELIEVIFRCFRQFLTYLL
jgi:hypothetical protein